MPLLDLPLDQLKTFTGRNPCPVDHDAYWSRALAAMHALGTACELVPLKAQPRNAECYDLYFTGVGGARVHAKFVRPRARSGKVPAVLLFHGYTGNSGDWFDKLAWASEGYCVAALDCRGQGGSSEDVGGVIGTTMRGHIVRGLHPDQSADKLLFRDIFLDTAQLARVVMAMPEVDAARVGATGGSQGGGLTLACAALEPAVKLAAPLYPFLCDYRRVWEMDLAKDAYEELRTWFRQFDPLHTREEEIFSRLGYIDCQHLAKRIRARVLMFVSLMDSVCPPSTQFAAYNRIAAPKDLVIYPDFWHEALPGASDRIREFMTAL
jgi:cephalosporin-C deacetylase